LVLQKILGHVKWLQRQMALIDGQIVAAMKPYKKNGSLFRPFLVLMC